MDDLRYWMYQHSKDCSVQSLPPTSREIRMYILRALSTTYISINCLHKPTRINFLDFGYEELEGLLLPSQNRKILSRDLRLYLAVNVSNAQPEIVLARIVVFGAADSVSVKLLYYMQLETAEMIDTLT